MPDQFTEFEHNGWQRVARQYEAAWSGLTRSFIPHLLKAADVRSGQKVLDIACGPGYAAEGASEMGADPIGVDFSAEMVSIARERNPAIEFSEGDAQKLIFAEGSFDRVVMNFGLLHLANPEAAFSEAWRVLRSGGRYAFTVWANPQASAGARLVEDAVKAQADMSVLLPSGPDYFAYGSPRDCRLALEAAGFDPQSLTFETVSVDWQIPSASHLFESELHAGVRTAALLAKQKPEALKRIRIQIVDAMQAYKNEAGFAVPFAAHLIAVSR